MNFWKTFLAALVALIVGSGIMFILSLIFGFSIIASLGSSTQTVPERSVLCISLNESIIDSPTLSPLSNLNTQDMSIEAPLTLLKSISAIENAAKDDRIMGIYIYLNGTGTISAANIEELRHTLERFKQSGKFVVAYDDNFLQSEYYLASVADRVSLHPEGMIDWRGLSFGTMFYKGLLDKLDVEVEIFRPTECKFKSAVEPYFLTKMSDANRLQMEVLADSMWKTIVSDVAKSRNLDAENLIKLAANIEVNDAKNAKQYGLIDAIEYEDEVDSYLEQLGVKRNYSGKLHKTTLSDYIAAHAMFDTSLNATSENQVAIIYADGQIVDGNTSGDGFIFGNTLANQIRDARLNKNIKAVVLRVNSPGGSALASDIIWREMTLLQKSKPVVVSMGEYAASGGYYISAPADYIIADRLTLTGSIGVFGTMFNLENLLTNKLGITIDFAGTSPTAGGMSFLRPITEREKEVVLKSVDNVYDVFTTVVANGRNLTKQQVYDIAEGRVWSGSNAVENGLADANGGINEAIIKAAELADLGNDFRFVELKLPVSEFELWLQTIGMATAKTFGVDYNIYNTEIQNIVKDNIDIFVNSGIQMLEPQRMKLVL